MWTITSLGQTCKVLFVLENSQIVCLLILLIRCTNFLLKVTLKNAYFYNALIIITCIFPWCLFSFTKSSQILESIYAYLMTILVLWCSIMDFVSCFALNRISCSQCGESISWSESTLIPATPPSSPQQVTWYKSADEIHGRKKNSLTLGLSNLYLFTRWIFFYEGPRNQNCTFEWGRWWLSQFLAYFLRRKAKIMFLLASMKLRTSCSESPLLILIFCPKNCSKSRPWYTLKKIDQWEQRQTKIKCGFQNLFRISKWFQRKKANINLIFLFLLNKKGNKNKKY